jgi:hypothetical protein
LVLEGGYGLKFVPKIAAAAIAKMSRTLYVINDKAPVTDKRRRREGQKVIKDVKEVQKAFWNIY